MAYHHITVNLSSTGVSSALKEDFKSLLGTYLAVILQTDESTALEWLMIKAAQYRGIPEYEMQEEINTLWREL